MTPAQTHRTLGSRMTSPSQQLPWRLPKSPALQVPVSLPPLSIRTGAPVGSYFVLDIILSTCMWTGGSVPHSMRQALGSCLISQMRKPKQKESLKSLTE
jgi:hypothetical protein